MSAIPPPKPLSVLWLAPFVPYPPEHGGAVRIFNMIRHLSKQCDITLLALTDAPCDPTTIETLQEYCRSVRTFIRPRRLMFFPPHLAPPAVFLDRVPELRRAVHALQQTAHFDILQIEYPSLAQYLAYRGNSTTFLTELEVSYVTCFRRFQTERSWPVKLRRLLAFVMFFYYELRQLPRFDTVITMSELDRRTLLRWLPRLPAAVIPNGVDTEYFVPAPQPAVTDTVTFVGNLNHPPNVDAVLFFVQQVWPELSGRHPTLKFVVVGTNPPPAVQALANDRIAVTGRVSDVRDYYAQSSAVVVPVRFGSGTRVKLLEAFATGVPAISTTIGAEGIEATPDKHYLPADSPEAFIAQTSRLIQDKSLGEHLRRDARHLVENRYDWRVLAQQQMELYERNRRQRQS